MEANHKFEGLKPIGKIDLKDAYFSIKIHPNHKKFLKFRWRGISYQYRALHFGLATAPRVFSKVMQEAVKQLREKGRRGYGLGLFSTWTTF